MRRPTEITQEALRRIAELYAIEAEIRGSPAEERLAVRKARSEPPGFPGECFICELRLPDHRFRWKHNKLFLLLPEGMAQPFQQSSIVIPVYRRECGQFYFCTVFPALGVSSAL